MAELLSGIFKNSPLPKILPSVVRWVLGEEGEEYSFSGVWGFDNHSQLDRNLGIKRLSHLGLFGEHSLVSHFATIDEPVYFLERNIQADGLTFPALQFAVKTENIYGRKNDSVFFITLSCDKIEVEAVPKGVEPSVSFTFNLTSIVDREKESRKMMDMVLEEGEFESKEVLRGLTNDGEFTVSKRTLLLKLAKMLASQSEYTKDLYVSKARIRVSKGVFRSELALKSLKGYLNLAKIGTGRAGRSRKG